ncbi:hypothetical protein GGI35DRAFT_434562 [Trichoderma velutinum]
MAIILLRIEEASMGVYYQHLPNAIIDWSLGGSIFRCKVVGAPCFGKAFNTFPNIVRHLKGATHVVSTNLPTRRLDTTY